MTYPARRDGFDRARESPEHTLARATRGVGAAVDENDRGALLDELRPHRRPASPAIIRVRLPKITWGDGFREEEVETRSAAPNRLADRIRGAGKAATADIAQGGRPRSSR
jgi:hypothetical protein